MRKVKFLITMVWVIESRACDVIHALEKNTVFTSSIGINHCAAVRAYDLSLSISSPTMTLDLFSNQQARRNSRSGVD